MLISWHSRMRIQSDARSPEGLDSPDPGSPDRTNFAALLPADGQVESNPKSPARECPQFPSQKPDPKRHGTDRKLSGERSHPGDQAVSQSLDGEGKGASCTLDTKADPHGRPPPSPQTEAQTNKSGAPVPCSEFLYSNLASAGSLRFINPAPVLAENQPAGGAPLEQPKSSGPCPRASSPASVPSTPACVLDTSGATRISGSALNPQVGRSVPPGGRVEYSPTQSPQRLKALAPAIHDQEELNPSRGGIETKNGAPNNIAKLVSGSPALQLSGSELSEVLVGGTAGPTSSNPPAHKSLASLRPEPRGTNVAPVHWPNGFESTRATATEATGGERSVPQPLLDGPSATSPKSPANPVVMPGHSKINSGISLAPRVTTLVPVSASPNAYQLPAGPSSDLREVNPFRRGVDHNNPEATTSIELAAESPTLQLPPSCVSELHEGSATTPRSEAPLPQESSPSSGAAALTNKQPVAGASNLADSPGDTKTRTKDESSLITQPPARDPVSASTEIDGASEPRHLAQNGVIPLRSEVEDKGAAAITIGDAAPDSPPQPLSNRETDQVRHSSEFRAWPSAVEFRAPPTPPTVSSTPPEWPAAATTAEAFVAFSSDSNGRSTLERDVLGQVPLSPAGYTQVGGQENKSPAALRVAPDEGLVNALALHPAKRSLTLTTEPPSSSPPTEGQTLANSLQDAFPTAAHSEAPATNPSIALNHPDEQSMGLADPKKESAGVSGTRPPFVDSTTHPPIDAPMPAAASTQSIGLTRPEHEVEPGGAPSNPRHDAATAFPETQPSDHDYLGAQRGSDSTGSWPPMLAPIKDGTLAAQALSQMNLSSKPAETACDSEQELPPAAIEAGKVGKIGHSGAAGSLSAGLDGSGLAGLVLSSNQTHHTLAQNDPTSALPSEVNTVSSTQRLSELIMPQVKLLDRSRSEVLSVLLTPDANTSITLHLRLTSNGVEAHATCDRGDLVGLNSSWTDLQASLATQGVHLLPLQPPTTDKSSTAGLSFSGEQKERGQSMASQNGAELFPPQSNAQRDIANGRASTRKRISSRLLESWA